MISPDDSPPFTVEIANASLLPASMELWKAAVLVFSDASAGAALALKAASGNAGYLTRRLKAAPWVDSAVRKDVARTLRKLRFPKHLFILGPGR